MKVLQKILLAGMLSTLGLFNASGCRPRPAGQSPAVANRPVIETDVTGDGQITTLRLKPMLIDSPDATGEPLEFTANIAYKEGQELVVLPVATITFTSNVKNRFSRNPEMILLLDGEPIKVSSDKEKAGAESGLLGRYENESMEWLQIITEPQLFTKIARSKTVEVKVDSLTFRLDDEQRKGLWLLSILLNHIPAAA